MNESNMISMISVALIGLNSEELTEMLYETVHIEVGLSK